MLKIGVIGTGYVGLTQAVMMASRCDNTVSEVVAMDINQDIVDTLNEGVLTIFEDGMYDEFDKARSKNKIRFTSNVEDLLDCYCIFVAVGTPSNDDGSANLDYLNSAIESLNKPNSIKALIIKSTVPVGTTVKVQSKINQDFQYLRGAILMHSPEFLREGNSVEDLLNPSRILIGFSKVGILENNPNELDQEVIDNVFNSLIEVPLNKDRIGVSTSTSTELVKYISNVTLATRIAQLNEFTDLANEINSKRPEMGNIDLNAVFQFVSMDPRIGKLPTPGPGLGGSCFIKDIKEFSTLMDDLEIYGDISTNIIKSDLAHRDNLGQVIVEYLGGLRKPKPKVLYLGASFKAGTDDARESPTETIIEYVNQYTNAYSELYCPMGLVSFHKLYPNCEVSDFGSSYDEFDAIVIVTEFEEFKDTINDAIKEGFTGKIFDFRGLITDPAILNTTKFYSIINGEQN